MVGTGVVFYFLLSPLQPGRAGVGRRVDLQIAARLSERKHGRACSVGLSSTSINTQTLRISIWRDILIAMRDSDTF